MPLDATVGGTQSTSYVTVAVATSLLHGRLQVDAWYAADPDAATTLTDRREAALMQATRLLDATVHWYGRPTTLTQALAWPQTGQVDSFARAVDPTVIPVALQRATAYYALALLDQDTAGAPVSTQGAIKSTKIGDLQITYENAATTRTSASTPHAMPDEVQLLLRPYGLVPGWGMVPVFRT